MFKSNEKYIWLMRQAGRYLPEYKELRKKHTDFLRFCFTPDSVKEATLQPLHRFDIDAAILFSDILTIPHALGQSVTFLEKEGPQLSPKLDQSLWKKMSKVTDVSFKETMEPIYDAIRLIKKELTLFPKQKNLIGFVGAPWTIFTYMMQEKGVKDRLLAKIFSYQERIFFQNIMELLTHFICLHAIEQIKNGADCIQIFDSWAGDLPAAEIELYSFLPIQKIIANIKNEYPHIPIIVFPKSVGYFYERFTECGADILSIDSSVPLSFARDVLHPKIGIQGNLDPAILVAGGDVLQKRTREIMENLYKRTSTKPFVFNLGHGIVPQTPIDNVSTMIEIIRAF